MIELPFKIESDAQTLVGTYRYSLFIKKIKDGHYTLAVKNKHGLVRNLFTENYDINKKSYNECRKIYQAMVSYGYIHIYYKNYGAPIDIIQKCLTEALHDGTFSFWP